MAKKSKTKRVVDTGKKSRRVSHAEVAAALGALPVGRVRRAQSPVEQLASSGAFKSLSSQPGARHQECMIAVAWTALGDARDDGRGHLVMRDRVTADLGLDAVPDPPFTSEEMQEIARAAKLAALKCLGARRK